MRDFSQLSKERLESSKYAIESWLTTSKEQVAKYEAELKAVVEALKAFGSDSAEAVQTKTEEVVETVKEEVKKAAPKRSTKKSEAKAEESEAKSEKSDKEADSDK